MQDRRWEEKGKPAPESDKAYDTTGVLRQSDRLSHNF